MRRAGNVVSTTGVASPGMLFNLAKYPAETHHLVQAHPGKLRELHAIIQVAPDKTSGPRPISGEQIGF